MTPNLGRTARALVALSVSVMPACTEPNSGWSRVDLTGAGEIVALAPGPAGLLVGRFDPTADTRSSIQAVDLRSGEASSIHMSQGQGYAAEARLVSLSSSGDRIVALGAARGGAHGNPRWTVWSGDGQGLLEQPQTFETFGGWDAGGLAGSAYGSDGPILIGSWRAGSGVGLDVATWHPDGDRWVRTPVPDSAFRATPHRQPAVGGLAATADRYVAVGSTTLLGDQPREVATAWLASGLGGQWQEIQLPTPSRGTGLARAEVISCAEHHCAIAGRRGGQVFAWRLTVDERQTPVAGQPVPLGHPDPDTRIGVAAGDAGNDWVAMSEGQTRVLSVGPTGATNAFETSGMLTAMTRASDGSPIVAVTPASGDAQLWRGP